MEKRKVSNRKSVVKKPLIKDDSKSKPRLKKEKEHKEKTRS
jgi:hypothetical protein